MDSYDSAAAAARMDGRVGVEKPPIITLKFRFYYKERAGIFHGMPHLLGRHYEKVTEQGRHY